ncbi:MAG: low molecular weight protein-tyrosine-phosphatase [Burkholderiaceae bacterium]
MKTNLLMVCRANICRSPIAHSVVAHLAQAHGLAALLHVDSAGTHARAPGEPVDARARAALAERGYAAPTGRSRRLDPADFSRFDMILAMDRENFADLTAVCPPEFVHKLGLLLESAQGLPDSEVRDPYFGSREGFERVIDLCESAAVGLIGRLRQGVDRRD